MSRMGKRLVAVLVIVATMLCMVCTAGGVSASSSGFIARNSKTAMARLESAEESLTPHRSVKVYNFQGNASAGYTYKMDKNDLAILKEFAKEHFTDKMSAADKVAYTMEWIHTKVQYANTSALWSKIAGKSWVEAIFQYKTGQCAQYNGALACMMAYLGYDSSMVQGYRSSRYSRSVWQHFWAQVKIDGKTYLVEAGNRGKSGDWYYLCAKYSETKGYVY